MEVNRPDIDTVLRNNLTPDQYAAATDPAYKVLCLACAGSGKSRTLAYRIARLVAEGASPESIVAFTFTEKAADSIKLRISQALAAAGFDPTMVGAMYVGTIHSYCFNILGEIHARYRQFDVLDDNRLKLYLISRYPQLDLYELRRDRSARYFDTIREAAEAWKILNDEMVDIDAVADHDPLLARVLSNIRHSLDRDHFIDFSMMIREVAEALGRGDADALRAVEHLQHLMVDEYQDVNPSQEALIRSLHEHSESLFVVGDDDQAIYSWRGADVSNIIDFPARYTHCTEHTLSQNFRSAEPIVQSADNFIHAELGPARVAKDPVAMPFEGSGDYRVLHFDNRAEEAEWVAERIESLLGTEYVESDGTRRGLTPADFAILMRSTGGSEQDGTYRYTAFAQALNARNIPFTLGGGGGIFDRPQVHALREAFRLLRNEVPDRTTALNLFEETILPAYPHADFHSFTQVLAEWGRLIHAPIGDTRRRVFPQQLVHDLLEAFGLGQSNFDAGTMADLGVFSRIMQDVEAVYLSIDSAQRFQEILNFLDNVAESGYDAGSVELQHRPDAVSILTVHKAKGLEFPAVFIADAQRGRFPSRRMSYRGWLPNEVLADALNRGAYQSTHEEEARLFYTALTRAERYLYVTGCRLLPGGQRPNPPSPFTNRLQHDAIARDPGALPPDLVPAPPRRRLDENILPTSFSEIKTYLRCPAEYRYSHLYGFSPPITEMFGFGITVHAAIGRLHQRHPNEAPTTPEAEEIARDMFHLKHVAPSNDPENRPGPYERALNRAVEIVRNYVERYANDFTHLRQVEVRFEIPLEQAVISGSIDLLLRVDPEGHIQNASVIDFKTMEGGPEPTENRELDWSELSLQVQLYARAATEVLGEAARTGSVHLLKDNQRVEVPVDQVAVDAAVDNVTWAVEHILMEDFPMRPSREKCDNCDFRALCPQRYEPFHNRTMPPAIHIPASGGGRSTKLARAFSDVDVPDDA